MWTDVNWCVAACVNPADVVLALDGSGSVGKQNFMRSLQFAQDMVMGLPIQAGARVRKYIGLQMNKVAITAVAGGRMVWSVQHNKLAGVPQ